MSEGRRTHLDLFSGFGGFALAAKWAGFETVAFCEREPFAQRVLRKNFPGIPIIDDIFNLDGKDYTGAALLSGGFPCQPFSSAGLRRGEEDDRSLWGEMFRVISEARPTWVVGENVVGFRTMGLDAALSDLERIGYATQSLIVPALAVDAPHRRDRIFLLGHLPDTHGVGHRRRVHQERGTPKWKFLEEEQEGDPVGGEAEGCSQFSRGEPATWSDESGICRVDDGVPDRVERLRGLGNAVCVPLVFEILRAI